MDPELRFLLRIFLLLVLFFSMGIGMGWVARTLLPPPEKLPSLV